jgi:N-methylhydantoinase A
VPGAVGIDRARAEAGADEIGASRLVDQRFRGQTHLIRVALPSPNIDRAALQELFEAAYFRRFQASA